MLNGNETSVLTRKQKRRNPLYALNLEAMERCLHFLDGKSLVVASSVCIALRQLVRREWRTRIYKRTEQHVGNAAEFYRVLGEARGIVSGSSALSVFSAGAGHEDVNAWTMESDLDVYVPNDRALRIVTTYLSRNDGYDIVPMSLTKDEAYWEDASGITSITRLCSPSFASHIDIISAAADAVTLPIATFWSTLVMNYITDDTVVCLYPQTTLQREGLLNPSACRVRAERCAEKYVKRGFSIRNFNENDPDECYRARDKRDTTDARALRVQWAADEREQMKDCGIKHSHWQWSADCARFIGRVVYPIPEIPKIQFKKM